MAVERRTTEGIAEKVGRALVEGAFLNPDQLKASKAKAQATGKRLTEVLLADQVVTPETLATVLSFQLNVPVVELRQFRIQPEAVALVPEEVARERGVLPLSLEGDVLRVAMEDPQDVQLVDTLAALTHKRIKPVLPLRGGLREAIDANYKSTSRMAEEL
ncbi:MAG: hypothetical protein AAB270_03935, partial [Chloroflexota bacterium]